MTRMNGGLLLDMHCQVTTTDSILEFALYIVYELYPVAIYGYRPITTGSIRRGFNHSLLYWELKNG